MLPAPSTRRIFAYQVTRVCLPRDHDHPLCL